jgi:acylphosphatase
MKKISAGLTLMMISFLFLFNTSCSVKSGERVYELKNAQFPHPSRMNGHSYKEQFFSYEDHYSDSSVLVVVPDAYKKSNKTDLMIFIHGWGNTKDKCNKKFELTEQLNESGKNILLVIPEGPVLAKDSFSGKFSDKDGFQRFIDELADSLKQDGIIRNKRIGRIILTGHSGAYHAMAHILRRGGYTDKISDVVIFDGLYTYENDFLRWVLEHDGRLIDIYTQNGGTLDNSEVLMAKCDSASIDYYKGETKGLTKLPDDRVIFLYSDLKHGEVMHLRKNVLKVLKSL